MPWRWWLLTTEEIASEALRLIDVEYEVLPAVFDMEEALKPGAPQLYDEFPGNVVTPGVPFFGPKSLKEIVMGDVEKGFEEADVVTEGTFGYENIPNPLPPEPPGAIALWEEPNQVTLWVSNQASYMDTVTLHHVSNRKVEVRSIGGPCGGSYGSKFMSWQVQAHAALLSRATGKPVKLILTKEEHLAAFTLRPGSRMKARVGMKRDGTVTAVAGTWLIDTGYYSMTTQSQVAVGCGEVQIAVRCPNWDLRPVIVCTNRNASGIVRGFGGQELKCALIPLLSLAMEKAGVDPLEFFKKNFVKPGDGYLWRDGLWYDVQGRGLHKRHGEGGGAFRLEGEVEGMAPAHLRRRRETERGGRWGSRQRRHRRGCIRGLRAAPPGWDGRGLLLRDRARHRPEDQFPEDGGGGPSDPAGAGLHHACRLAGQSLRIRACGLERHLCHRQRRDRGGRGCKAEAFRDPRADAAGRPRGAGHRGRVCLCAGPTQGSGSPGGPSGRTGPARVSGDFRPDYTLSNCMMTFVEVEVDTETGKVDLVRVVNATDVGTIIDPPGLQGQLNGCLGSAGIDSALFEETVIDRGSGHILNPNLIDYKWRSFLELPDIENVVLETPFDSHRFHAVGVGEIATTPGPSAVLMAASNAIGTWVHEYPVTPERILKALGKVKPRVRGKKGGAA